MGKRGLSKQRTLTFGQKKKISSSQGGDRKKVAAKRVSAKWATSKKTGFKRKQSSQALRLRQEKLQKNRREAIENQRQRSKRTKKQPKSLEYWRNLKAANPRQVKGLKSKLSILQVSHHRRAESNSFDETFRDSYFASKVKQIPQMSRSVEMFELQDELGPMAASLPHVLLHKQQIFQCLMTFLSNEHYRSLVRHGVR
ncbi:hypothetical protein RFI_39372 [Reticulomyxa filosa]|uniref:Uncharacterized protein n=1 Tax=Reticulomyxa filosa TaxID=46433 RepID=X6L9U8_RETFI|nr:hypothetical protein RFI_39372 [Reticulomyxa filosa]|eukprot:ETN98145.1 hypothetical protein RFI_39372 [Reticulomyxa filosa]